MGSFKQEIKEGAFEFGLDSNNDGEMSIKGKIFLNEAIAEAMKRGNVVEGAKVVDFKFELTKMVIKIDTDKDGESLLELVIDLAEAFDEVSSRFTK